MLLRSCFIVDICDDLSESYSELQLPYNSNLCLYIHNADDIPGIIKRVYSLSIKTSFFLSFDTRLIPMLKKDEVFSEYLTPIFFHYKYLKSKFDIPIVVGFGNDSDDFDEKELEEELKPELKKNSYGGINFLIFNKSKITAWDKTDSVDSVNKFDSDYMEALLSTKSVNEFFFIQLDNIFFLNKIIDEMTEVEKKLSFNAPDFYELLKNYSDSEKEKSALFLKVNILFQRLDSMQNYDSIKNLPEPESRKRISQIVDFYKTEYEILPAWYKKFGHIIKVIMGKRSFRSLFNDNVKKYKD